MHGPTSPNPNTTGTLPNPQPKHHRYNSAPMLSFWKIRAGVPDQGKHRAGTSNPVQELGMLSLEGECD